MNDPRRMLRYQLVVSDNPTTLVPQSDPVHVAAGRLGVGPDAAHLVEFWAEGTLDGVGTPRRFQVFGTGHVIPAGARYWGTTARTPEGLVWHLYEVDIPAPVEAPSKATGLFSRPAKEA